MVDAGDSNLCHLPECSSSPAFRSAKAFQKVVGSAALKMRLDGSRDADLINALTRFSPTKRAEDTRSKSKIKQSDSKRKIRASKKRSRLFLRETIKKTTSSLARSSSPFRVALLYLVFIPRVLGSLSRREAWQSVNQVSVPRPIQLRLKRCASNHFLKRLR